MSSWCGWLATLPGARVAPPVRGGCPLQGLVQYAWRTPAQVSDAQSSARIEDRLRALPRRLRTSRQDEKNLLREQNAM